MGSGFASPTAKAMGHPTLHDFQTPQFSATIKAGAKRELSYELITHQGYNKKQDNVTLTGKS